MPVTNLVLYLLTYQDVCDGVSVVVIAASAPLTLSWNMLASLESLLFLSLCGCLSAYIGFILVAPLCVAYLCTYVLCCLYVQTFCWFLGYF